MPDRVEVSRTTALCVSNEFCTEKFVYVGNGCNSDTLKCCKNSSVRMPGSVHCPGLLIEDDTLFKDRTCSTHLF